MPDRLLKRRRRALALAVVLVALASFGATTAAAQSPSPSPGEGHGGGYVAATPWSQIQGGPMHAGVVPGGSASTANAGGPVPPYTKAWQFDPTGDAGLAGPAIAGDVVYAVGTNNVYALDLATGSVRWQMARAPGPITPPAVGTSSANAPPILVYTQGAGTDSQLVGLDTTSRKILWKVRLEDDTFSGVALDSGTAFVGNTVGKIFAVDVASGKVKWTVIAAKGHVESAPAVGNGVVYFRVRDPKNSAVTMVALDEFTGKIKWQKGLGPLGGSTAGVILGANGGLFTVVDTFASGEATAVDPSTGDVRWSANLRTNVFPFSYPASSDGKVYVADASAGVYALNADTGARLWDYQVASATIRRSSPIVVGNYVVVGLDDGTTLAIDATSGHLVWEASSGDGSIKSLGVSQDMLVASKGGDKGGLVAYAHDATGELTDLVSPTQMNVARVAVAYVGAFVVVGALILVIARVLGGPLRTRVAPVEEDEDDLPDDPLDEGAG